MPFVENIARNRTYRTVFNCEACNKILIGGDKFYLEKHAHLPVICAECRYRRLLRDIEKLANQRKGETK
jgi:DNA-directed RNA polymerase subunit RPC12/RpoP